MKKTLPVLNVVITFCFLFLSQFSQGQTSATGTINFATVQVLASNYYVKRQAFEVNNYHDEQVGRDKAGTAIAATPIITTTGTLTTFLACTGSPSAPQSFTVSGSNLIANITVTAPAGFEISTASGGTYGSTVTLAPAAGSATGSVFIRLSATATGNPTGQIAVATNGAPTLNLAASGTVNGPPSATVGAITPVTTTALTFGLIYNNPVNSPTQYSVAPGIRAMSGFNRISNFSLTGSPIGISIPASTPGTYDFILTVVNGQTGCSSAPIPFTLTVNAPAPGITTTGTLSTFTACAGTASAQQSFVVSGTNLTGNVTITAPAGFEVSTTSGSGFSNSVLLTPTSGTIANTTIFARLAASAAAAASGNITLAANGAATQNIAVSSAVNPLPSATLGTVDPINSLAASFSIPYSNITGGADRFSVSAGANAMPGFASVNNFGLGASSVTVNIPASPVGTYDFNFTVTNSTTGCVSVVMPFTLTVKSAVSTLASLTMSAGTISPAFTAGTNGYTTTVDNLVHNLTITPTATNANASIQVSLNGGAFAAVVSGSASQPLPLNIGGNTIDVKVTAQDGTTINTYSIAATRGPNPAITASGTLTAVNTTYGTASATPATFIASGSNLNGDISVTAPVGYELSTTISGSYAKTLTLVQSGGVVNSTNIFVRLAATTAAGSYSGNITLSNPGTADITVATTLSTVNKATLTYSANAIAKKYGDANPAFNGTVTGFVDGETLAVASGTLGFTSAATTTSGVGSYAIDGFGLTASNYNFVQAAANSTALTVNPATLAYKATPATKTYGDVNPAFTGTVTGFVNGDTQASVLSGTLSFTSTAIVTNGVGRYAINGSGLVQNNNYLLIQAPGNATALTVAPATLTYVAEPASKTVGEANPTFTGTITGFVNSDNQADATSGSLIWTSPATVSSTPGTYAINGSGLNAINYTFVQAAANSTKLVINDAATPANVATNISFSNVANTSATINWANGGGIARAVFILAGSSSSPAPVNNTSYKDNPAFGAGDQAGAGWYCIYNGTGTTVNVTGLIAGTDYRVKVVEYNGIASTEKYALADGLNNPRNTTTTGGPITISSITRTTAAITNNASVQYTVTFASNVSNLQSNNFSLTTTGTLTGVSVGAITGSGSVYTVTVNTGTGNGDITLNLNNAAGLAPGISTPLPFSGQSYTIDKTTPGVSQLTLISNNTNTATAKVGNLLTLNFIATEKLQTPGVSIAGHTVTASNPGNDGVNWKANYTMVAGDTEGLVDFSVIFADLAGNNALPFNAGNTHQTLTFDRTAPAISVGNPSLATTITNPVTYIVTYSDANFNASTLNLADIALNRTGTANASTIAVSGTGGTRSITLSGISGVGTLGITIGAGTASDAAGNLASASVASTTFAVTSPLLATVVTDRVTVFDKTTAHYSGSITANGGVNVTEKGIVYSLNNTPVTSDNKLTDASPGNIISADATNLAIGTVYHVRAYAINSVGTAYGEEQQFKTASDVPVVTTNPITAFTSSTATFTGLVNSNQGAAITEDGVVYGTTTNPTVTDSKLVNAGTASTIQVSAAGLTAATIYHVRAFATNAIGTSYGTDKTFTTSLSDKADLSGLLVGGTTINPVFASGTTTYTAFVGNATNTVTITPTAAEAHATIQVNINGGSFTILNSGSVSPALGLNIGFNAINVKVVAQDGTTNRTYSLNITRDKAPQTITLAATATKTYGDADYDAGATSSNPNIAITYASNNTAVATIVNGKVHIVGAGIATITASQTGDANSNPAADAVQQLTVNQKALTITANNKNKVYGDLLANETGSHAFMTNGLVNAETVGSVNIEYNTGKTAAAAVGTYTAQVRPFQATGGTFNAVNYNVTYANADIIVSAMPVTVTADAKTKIYGDIDPVLTFTLTKGALVNSDTFTGALTRIAGANVGTYAIKQGILSLSNNYTLTYAGASLTIGAKPIAVTAIAKNKTYGEADPALTFTNTALVGTDAFTGALTRDAGENVGIYAIKQGTLALSSNYTLTYTGANLTITAKAIAVTAIAKNKTYGNADPALTFTNTALIGTDTFTGALTRDAGENVGIYAIKQGTLALNNNYTLSYTGANLTISTKAIAVTAITKTKTYGDADPALTFTNTALVGTDAFTGALARDAGENIGTYAIKQGTLALNNNYTLTYTGANLTIGTKAIAVTAIAKIKTYGDADPALTFTNTALVGTDGFTGTLTRDAGENAGTYAIKRGSLALNSNYTLTYTGANLTIGTKTLIIAADNKSKVYGQPNPVLTVTYTGFVNGDGASTLSAQPVISTTATTTSPVANYPITVTGARAANYNINYINGSMGMLRAVLIVVVANKTKIEGAINPLLTLEYLGFIKGETNTSLSKQPVLRTTASTTSPAGSYPITASGAAADNYVIDYVQGTLTITNHSTFLTVTANNASKIYGTANPELSFTYSGFTNGDTPSGLSRVPSISTTATPASDAGSYPITVSGGVSSKYTFVYVPATLTVSKAALSAAAGPKSRSYGEANPPPTAAPPVKCANILTPNGDGKNDTWTISDIQLYPNNTVTIYDRAGREVYHRKSYNNDWDGTYRGTSLAQGIYYYVVDLGPGYQLLKGSVTILKVR